MNLRRYFLVVVTLAGAFVTPALGQSAASTPGSAASRNASAAAIPAFIGTWVHPSIPGFEPPATGPGPVVNKSRVRGGPQPGVSNVFQLVGDYTNPILQPWAAEVVKTFGDISLAGVGYPTPRNQCWPEGMPFILGTAGIQMLQGPDEITILYSVDHEVRHVRMNEPHPAHLIASWYGDSVGHYEGDTLVIDTVGMKMGPFSMVDWYGTPYTPALHVVERYRLIDYDAAKEGLERDAKENFHAPAAPMRRDLDYRGKHLQLQFTVDDKGAFTMPWTATITYGRPLGDWVENVCAENPHKYGTEKDAAVPTADKPDF